MVYSVPVSPASAVPAINPKPSAKPIPDRVNNDFLISILSFRCASIESSPSAQAQRCPIPAQQGAADFDAPIFCTQRSRRGNGILTEDYYEEEELSFIACCKRERIVSLASVERRCEG